MNLCHVCLTIKELQSENSNIFLCGSAALILKGVLPERPIHDLDFVCSDMSIISKLNLWPDSYPEMGKNSEYTSYSAFSRHQSIKINILLFDDKTRFNLDVVSSEHGDIVCQDVNDIIAWKYKYNRKKDTIDLENIAANMLEKAIFTK